MSAASSIGGAGLVKAIDELTRTFKSIASHATGAVGSTLGGGAGGTAGAATTVAGGAAGMATAAGPAAAAAIGVVALAAAAKQGYDALREFAAAASPNGLKSMDQASQLFSATIGTTLLPVFVMLAAGVATAADAIWTDFKPKLSQMGAWYADNLPVFLAFGKAVAEITEWVVKAVGKIAAWIGGKDDRSYGKNPNNDPHYGVNEKGDGSAAPGDSTSASVPKAKPGGAGSTPEGKSFDWEGKFLGFMDMMTKDAGAAAGGKGGVGGAADAWKKAQEAAMGGGMDRQLLQRQTEAVSFLKEVLAEIKRRRAEREPNPFTN